MTQTQPVRYAGPYVEGEIPLDFTVKFDETDIDFAGYAQPEATLADQNNATLTFAGSVQWDDISVGRVLVSLAAGDVARVDSAIEHETRRLMLWAGDGGTKKVATVLIKYGIDAPVGVPPSI